MAKKIAYKSKIEIKGPRAASMDGFGILNKAGEFWTPRTFDNEAAAVAFFIEFWKRPGFTTIPPMSDFKFIPVRSRVTARSPAVLAKQSEGR